MELRHLRYFISVAEGGGFVRASAALRIAQPALSRQIHDLEEELDVLLFERSRRGASLTVAGECFFISAPDPRSRRASSVPGSKGQEWTRRTAIDWDR